MKSLIAAIIGVYISCLSSIDKYSGLKATASSSRCPCRLNFDFVVGENKGSAIALLEVIDFEPNFEFNPAVATPSNPRHQQSESLYQTTIDTTSYHTIVLAILISLDACIILDLNLQEKILEHVCRK